MVQALSSGWNFIRDWIADFPQWWHGLTLKQKTLPLALIGLYWAVLGAMGALNSDHLSVGLLVLLLSYGGRPAREKLLPLLLPLALTGIVYDSQRYYGDAIRGRIRVEEPYYFDKRFFGIETEAGTLTPNEWWQLHTHPVLDLITGFYYLVFIGMYVLLAAYFLFWLAKKGTRKMSAERIALEAPQVMWAFFVVNVIGYSTYFWYPAAPPWYVELYGLGPADLSALPNPAGTVRFDELLGTRFFTSFYGKSADVFGAIPSLHVAYPLLAVWYSMRFGAARIFSVTFYLIMCFAAVYLNHHYILDLIWGSAYAILVGVGMDWWFKRRYRNRLAELA